MMLRSLLITALLAGAPAALAQELPTPAQPTPQPAATPAPMPSAPTLSARSYVLMDFASGRVLAGREQTLPVEPASLTKMMTSYLVFKEIESGRITPDDLVTISEKAWRTGGSKMFIEVGKQVAVKDLLMGVVVQSGNDATVALAEHIAGTEEVFAGMMNAEAARLGMVDTSFTNAAGLPAPEHTTTAIDMARLSRALIQDYPEHYASYADREFTWNGITQHNRNSLLWRDASVDGIKTGHTESAGYCLAASAEREGMRLIAVVMGTDSETVRADEAQALLNYGFRFFESHTLYRADSTIAEPTVWKAAAPTLALGVTEAVVVTVPRGRYGELAATMDLPRQLVAPIAAGAQVGMLRVALGEEVLVERPLVAREALAEGGFFRRMSDEFWMWWEGE